MTHKAGFCELFHQRRLLLNTVTMDDKPQNFDGEIEHAASDRNDPSSGQPFSNSWRDEPLTPAELTKVTKILRACENKDRQQLVALATTSGGLIEDHVRRIACT